MTAAISFRTLFATLICVGVASSAHAITINFATGQDSLGVNQTTDSLQDANWTQSGASNPLSGANTYVIGNGGADSAFFAWDNNGPNSSWIAPNPNAGDGGYTDGSGAANTVTYTYAFDLTGYNLNTAAFSGGEWGVDNNATAYLNGTQIDDSGSSVYFSLVPFDLPVSSLLAGINTLTIQASGDFASNAVRLEGALTIDVPEPGSLSLLGFGLLALRAAYRRRTA